MSSLRFTRAAANDLRRAIQDAGGVEVFAIGDVDGGEVVGLTITCRGTEDRVPALLERPRTGQVVIHNHPSGDLRPSEADLHLASRYGEDGIGVVIVDSTVTKSNWVVEPHNKELKRVDPARVERFFTQDLPRALPGHEPRPTQIDLALAVLACLHDDLPVAAEAGTGTGKSLAYLVPAALWALKNDEKVVISTFTRSLQAQLFTEDLPILARAGLDVRSAVLQGRSNYLCKRRLGLALGDEPDDPHLGALAAWEGSSTPASRSELPFELAYETWERVESDADLTLHVRCSFYERCHYYQARREAAAAQLVVVNHALLMADRHLKSLRAPGVLPRYRRLILDEAHHLEQAATEASTAKVTARGIQRATAPLLSKRKRPGALARLHKRHTGSAGPLSDEAQRELARLAPDAAAALQHLRALSVEALTDLARRLGPQPLRLTPEVEGSERWLHELEPPVIAVLDALQASVDKLSKVQEIFADITLGEADLPPLQELIRARRRLGTALQSVSALLDEDPEQCRWIEAPRSKRIATASLHVSPIDVAPVVRRLIWDALPGTACTSATLTVAGSFTFWQGRVGLREPQTHDFPSPFDYAAQAVLGIPHDLPPPDHPAFLSRTSDVLADAVRLSGGGTFVLCTSYEAVERYAQALRATLGPRCVVLAQGPTGRDALLRRFREDPRAVLVGTDAFWEGVSVRGWGLRQVIVPRLPFRVPSDPLHAARVEAERRAGRDPFRSIVLPQAILRMRQGFGRLIRSRADRGVVLLLDRRLHDRSYGRVVLRSLPPAKPLRGPWSEVRDALEAYWALQRAARRWRAVQ
ncbi:MAG: helicase [Deltaproteobacteria bacterium]|nr:MAG: helicase [Deltaproteobacteria bacterium]